MFWWILGVIVGVLILGAIFRRNAVLAGGVLLGIVLAWIISYFLKPYVSGAEPIPVWLPPLPLATVATVLLVYGVLVWIRGNDRLPKVKRDDDPHHH
jgi:hypothetical protein